MDIVRQVLKFNLMESGLLSVFPWMTMAISANAGGWIADTLVSRGFSVTNVRKVPVYHFFSPIQCDLVKVIHSITLLSFSYGEI